MNISPLSGLMSVFSPHLLLPTAPCVVACVVLYCARFYPAPRKIRDIPNTGNAPLLATLSNMRSVSEQVSKQAGG